MELYPFTKTRSDASWYSKKRIFYCGWLEILIIPTATREGKASFHNNTYNSNVGENKERTDKHCARSVYGCRQDCRNSAVRHDLFHGRNSPVSYHVILHGDKKGSRQTRQPHADSLDDIAKLQKGYEGFAKKVARRDDEARRRVQHV